MKDVRGDIDGSNSSAMDLSFLVDPARKENQWDLENLLAQSSAVEVEGFPVLGARTFEDGPIFSVVGGEEEEGVFQNIQMLQEREKGADF